MEGPSVLSEWLALVPDEGWSDHSRDGALFATANSVHSELHEAGYTASSDGAGWSVSDLSGRVPLQELCCGEEVYLRRRFRHGGLLRGITGERFRDPLRPLTEVGLARRLQSAGVRTPEFVAARAQPLSGGAWRLDLLSRRLLGAKDVESAFARAHLDGLPLRDLRALLRGLGRSIAQLHDARFLHADLTPKNVLIDGRDFVFLDLDRSRFSENPLSDEERLDNLRRLLRYVMRREENAAKRLLQRSDYLRTLKAYRGMLGSADGGEGSAACGAWKADWRTILSAHAKESKAHRAGWLAERLFSKRAGSTGPTWRI